MRQILALLRQPRWALGAVVVVITSIGFAAAGVWQLSRLDDRRALNLRIEAARSGAAVQLTVPLAEYTPVTASGRWLGDAEVALPLQTRDGAAGVHLLTPLATEAGAFLVDRGWVPLDEVGEYPRASGEVDIVATYRSSRSGRATGVSEGGRPSVSQRDPEVVSDITGVSLEAVILDLVSELPPSAVAPLAPLAADLGEGNHLLYAIQWFSFIAIAVTGYVALLRRQIPSVAFRQVGNDADSG